MADNIVQPVLGDVCFQLRKKSLQRVAVWYGFREELVACLYRFLFGKSGVLTLNQDSGTIPKILRLDHRE